MAPTLEPPPPKAASSNSTPNATLPTTSVEVLLKDLHSLILNISFPKTKGAKTCSVPVETIEKARNLITSACDKYKHERNMPQLSTIQEQLNAISTHIGLSQETTPSGQAKTINPHPRDPRDTRCDITLSQVDRSSPVLLERSNEDIIQDVHTTLEESNTL